MVYKNSEKKMKNIASKLLSVALVVCLSGCSVFVPPKQEVRFNLLPPDARLLVNGEPADATKPQKFPRDHSLLIQASHEGLPDYHRMVDCHPNGYAFLDTVGLVLFLLPGIGLAAPGSHSLDEEEITVDMYHPYVAPPKAPPVKSLTPNHR